MRNAPYNVVLRGISILLLAWAGGCASVETQVQQKAEGIVAAGDNQDLPLEKSIALQMSLGKALTDSELEPARLKIYSTKTLRALLQAIGNVSFYAHGAQPYLTRQEQVLDELIARGAQKPEDIEDLFQRYLAARRFDRAKGLKDRFPNVKLWNLPEIIETKDSTEHTFRVYEISADSKTATVRHIPMETGPRIVMAAWHSCSVARRTLQYLGEEKDLARAMQSNGIILSGRFEPGGIVARNAEIPFTRTYAAYTESDWPGIDFSASPTFSFFKDGRLVRRFVGADDKPTFVAEFNQGLAAIGLKPQ